MNRTEPAPRLPRPREDEACGLLEEAAISLETAADQLAGPAPAYAEALTSSLRAIRQALSSLLAFHSLPPREGMTIAELGRPAAALASILHTSVSRAALLEPLETTLRRGTPVTRAVREDVTLAFYVARNGVLAVLGELPEAIRQPAARRVLRLMSASTPAAPAAPATPAASPRRSARRVGRLRAGVAS